MNIQCVENARTCVNPSIFPHDEIAPEIGFGGTPGILETFYTVPELGKHGPVPLKNQFIDGSVVVKIQGMIGKGPLLASIDKGGREASSLARNVGNGWNLLLGRSVGDSIADKGSGL